MHCDSAKLIIFLKRGYYPFAKEDDFDLCLRQIINQTSKSDIPLYANMNVSNNRKSNYKPLIFIDDVFRCLLTINSFTKNFFSQLLNKYAPTRPNIPSRIRIIPTIRLKNLRDWRLKYFFSFDT